MAGGRVLPPLVHPDDFSSQHQSLREQALLVGALADDLPDPVLDLLWPARPGLALCATIAA